MQAINQLSQNTTGKYALVLGWGVGVSLFFFCGQLFHI